MTILSGVLAAVIMAAPQNAPPAQVPPPVTQEGESTDLGEIVVSGTARETASRFVESIGAAATSRQLARWPRSVCVSVANLSAEPAQFLVDRVSRLAEDLGLRAGEPGCTANVVIIATVDAPTVARGLVEQNPSAFRPGGSGMTLTKAALDRFMTLDRPVRWWHVSVPTDSETGQRAVRLPGEDAPAINVSGASRLRSDIRDDLNKVIVIIDVDRIGGATFTQLADYVAMVAMAQIDAAATTAGLPTVLNLFDEPQITPGLSDWDLAYLTALYKAEPNRSTAQGQAGDLTSLMLQTRETVETEQP